MLRARRVVTCALCIGTCSAQRWQVRGAVRRCVQSCAEEWVLARMFRHLGAATSEQCKDRIRKANGKGPFSWNTCAVFNL
eukprot:2327368-Prymnesium_polylepis.1